MVLYEPLPPPTETFIQWCDRLRLWVKVTEVYPGDWAATLWCSHTGTPWLTYRTFGAPFTKHEKTPEEALERLSRYVQGSQLWAPWYRQDIAPIQAPAQFLPEEG